MSSIKEMRCGCLVKFGEHQPPCEYAATPAAPSAPASKTVCKLGLSDPCHHMDCPKPSAPAPTWHVVDFMNKHAKQAVPLSPTQYDAVVKLVEAAHAAGKAERLPDEMPRLAPEWFVARLGEYRAGRITFEDVWQTVCAKLSGAP